VLRVDTILFLTAASQARKLLMLKTAASWRS
jgi:hypothetical protein